MVTTFQSQTNRYQQLNNRTSEQNGVEPLSPSTNDGISLYALYYTL